MTRQEAFALVTDIIEEVIGIPQDELSESTNLADHDVDSLQLLDLISVVEERFDLSLPDEELESLKTVGDAVTLVLRYVDALEAGPASADRAKEG